MEDPSFLLSNLTMRDAWINLCYELAKRQGYANAGARKIIRSIRVEFPVFDDTLTLKDGWYAENSTAKMNQLKRNYYNDESMEKGAKDIRHWVGGRKYGSVGVSMHGKHKGKQTKQGFCIQSLTVSYFPHTGLEIDVFYRTTEVVKKFLADLIYFRDVVMPTFKDSLRVAPLYSVTLHFANVSVHPMFFCLLFTQLEPRMTIAHLKEIKKFDPAFHSRIIKWSARYLSGKPQNFMTADRVGRVLKEVCPEEVNKYIHKELDKL